MTTKTPLLASRWRAVAIGLAALLMGLIVWDGADRRAADATTPFSQDSVMADRQTLPLTLKIASFNIHGGKGSSGARSLGPIAELLSDTDYVGLYEVRATSGDAKSNQAASLGEMCGVSWLFAPTERRWWSDHFGNGLMYRIPVQNVVRIPLVNTRGKAFRNALLSILPLQNGRARILSVHIDREQDRQSQLKTVIDLFLNLEKPCVLMGDLNTTAADPLLVRLMEQPDVQNPLNDQLGGALPSQNIDWIFTRGLRTISAKLVENTASDHPLVQAEFEPQE